MTRRSLPYGPVRRIARRLASGTFVLPSRRSALTGRFITTQRQDIGVSHWNYRVMRDPDNPDLPYSIREVHYDSRGRLSSYTADPVAFESETLEGLRQDLEWATRSIVEPVLSPKDFPSEGTS